MQRVDEKLKEEKKMLMRMGQLQPKSQFEQMKEVFEEKGDKQNAEQLVDLSTSKD